MLKLMSRRVVRIDSYFSLPTDLAEEMKRWPEFVNGTDYSVKLASPTESVNIELQPENDEDARHVLITGVGEGSLFFSVLGCAAHAMAAHSDSVQLSRWENAVAPS
jgi:hypothetical protein